MTSLRIWSFWHVHTYPYRFIQIRYTIFGKTLIIEGWTGWMSMTQQGGCTDYEKTDVFGWGVWWYCKPREPILFPCFPDKPKVMYFSRSKESTHHHFALVWSRESKSLCSSFVIGVFSPSRPSISVYFPGIPLDKGASTSFMPWITQKFVCKHQYHGWLYQQDNPL